MGNLISVAICVKGKKEDRDAFYDALYIGANNCRIGRGLEDLDILWSEDEYSVFKGSANNYDLESTLGLFATRYVNDPDNLEMVSLGFASKKFNLTIEAFSSCDDVYEHYIYEKGREVKSDKKRRNIFKFSVKDIKKFTLINDYYKTKKD